MPDAAVLEPFMLEGRHVRLEPLRETHIPALVEASGQDRTNYQWTYTPDGVEEMTDYVRDALAKVASGAHVAFATVRKGVGLRRRRLGGGRHPVLRDRFLAVAAGRHAPAPRRARRGRHRLHLAGRFCAAHAGQHRGEAADDDARIRGVAGAPCRAADRCAEQALVGGHRADRRQARRDPPRRPARRRRHRPHLGALLHRRIRMAGGEGPPDGDPLAVRPDSGSGAAPTRPGPEAARRRGRQARASEAEILRTCRACTAASASSLGRTAATAFPVRWIFQASWSARSTV